MIDRERKRERHGLSHPSIPMYTPPHKQRLADAEEEDGDAYLGSAWADGKGLQRSLRGVAEVRAPGAGVVGRRG